MKNNNPPVSDDLCIEIANYIIDRKATVRATAKAFGLGKSTIHKQMTKNLAYINRPLYAAVKKVLAYNKAERHIRGGESTKKKYASQASA